MKKIISILLCLLIGLCLVGCKGDKNPEEVSSAPEPVVIPPKYTVFIDPGHGFWDGGCSSEFLESTESVVTLDMANKLKSALEAKNIKVILTHDGITFPSVSKIKELANTYGIPYNAGEMIDNQVFSAYERAIYTAAYGQQTKVDLFVSLHINSIVGYPDINRYEMYFYENNPFASQLGRLCSSISLELDNTAQIHATEKKDTFTVTRYSDFPSMLIECGYATNEAQAQKLNSESWRTTFTANLADSIETWLDTEFGETPDESHMETSSEGN